MSSNMFFKQCDKTIFGEQFGYALEYRVTKEFGEDCIRFAEKLIMSEDPQHTKKPQPIDLVSECIYKLIQENKADIIAYLYGRQVRFKEKDNMVDIKRQITDIQKSLIQISNEASPDVKTYLQSYILESIQGMPVH